MYTLQFRRAASYVRAVVIDDDLLTRAGMRQVFDEHAAVKGGQDHALKDALDLDPGYWRQFDVIVVDAHDEAEQQSQVGTDVYTGIALIEHLRHHQVDARIVAISPTRANPLLWERLTRSGADHVYQRVEFERSDDLVQAVVEPDDRHRPVSYPQWALVQQGLVEGGDPNKAVAAYKASPLYGRVRADITLEATGSRREVRRLKDEIVATGFVGSGVSPRWNEVRDYLLKLTGRMAVEPMRHPDITL